MNKRIEVSDGEGTGTPDVEATTLTGGGQAEGTGRWREAQALLAALKNRGVDAKTTNGEIEKGEGQGAGQAEGTEQTEETGQGGEVQSLLGVLRDKVADAKQIKGKIEEGDKALDEVLEKINGNREKAHRNALLKEVDRILSLASGRINLLNENDQRQHRLAELELELWKVRGDIEAGDLSEPIRLHVRLMALEVEVQEVKEDDLGGKERGEESLLEEALISTGEEPLTRGEKIGPRVLRTIREEDPKLWEKALTGEITPEEAGLMMGQILIKQMMGSLMQPGVVKNFLDQNRSIKLQLREKNPELALKIKQNHPLTEAEIGEIITVMMREENLEIVVEGKKLEATQGLMSLLQRFQGAIGAVLAGLVVSGAMAPTPASAQSRPAVIDTRHTTEAELGGRKVEAVVVKILRERQTGRPRTSYSTVLARKIAEELRRTPLEIDLSQASEDRIRAIVNPLIDRLEAAIRESGNQKPTEEDIQKYAEIFARVFAEQMGEGGALGAALEDRIAAGVRRALEEARTKRAKGGLFVETGVGGGLIGTREGHVWPGEINLRLGANIPVSEALKLQIMARVLLGMNLGVKAGEEYGYQEGAGYMGMGGGIGIESTRKVLGPFNLGVRGEVVRRVCSGNNMPIEHPGEETRGDVGATIKLNIGGGFYLRLVLGATIGLDGGDRATRGIGGTTEFLIGYEGGR